MDKITIDEMHNSLFDYAQAVSDENLMTEDKTIVGAINEVYGKRLIANSIGEPLNNTDTYSKMSNDINNLLSTFKTNMMNNGITVESGDKFKQLIDKIATMVEEGSGKGVQFVSGVAPNNFSNVQIGGVYFTCLNISLNFKPTILIVRNHGNYGFYIEDFYPDNFSIVTVDNGYDEYRNVKNYEIDKGNNNYSIPIGYEIQKDTTYYWAVGVGEEDTTLRDSLADILEEEGVEVTEEDTMADLIVKVDSEFDRKNANSGLDIISATELPATGRENQICVLTDNPVDNILVSQFVEDDPLSEDVIFVLLCNYKNDKQVVLGNQNYVHTSLYFLSISQGSTKLRSYIYKNNQWVIFTDTTLFAMDNGVIMNSDIFGELKEVKRPGSYCTFSKVNDGYSLNFKNMPSGEFIFAYENSISFANYSKMYVSFKDGTGAGTAGLDEQYVGIYFVIYDSSTKKTVYTKNITYWEQEYSSKVRTFEVDLTNVSHEGCLALEFDFLGDSRHLIITDWYLEQ